MTVYILYTLDEEDFLSISSTLEKCYADLCKTVKIDSEFGIKSEGRYLIKEYRIDENDYHFVDIDWKKVDEMLDN